jgi:dynein light chain roadblock-type
MFERITRLPGVLGAMIFSKEGIAIKSTFDEHKTNLFACVVHSTVNGAEEFGKALQSGSELRMLSIRSKRFEVQIAPAKDHVMIAIHRQLNEN